MSGRLLGTYVRLIMDACVQGPYGPGGSLQIKSKADLINQYFNHYAEYDLSLGGSRQILISLRYYNPINIICLPNRSPEPPPSGCVGLLEQMDRSLTVFEYRQYPPWTSRQVEVPEMMITRKSTVHPRMDESVK